MKPSSLCRVLAISDVPSLPFSSLTASKEAGATIEVNGKKVALGVPGAPRPEGADEKVYAGIPLRRGGTVEDAAGSVLLCVAFTSLPWLISITDVRFSFASTAQSASRRLWPRT